MNYYDINENSSNDEVSHVMNIRDIIFKKGYFSQMLTFSLSQFHHFV